MKKIAVLNNKGGVGKSTISVHISYGLAKVGYKVLLIDMDGQNDSSLFLGITESAYTKTFYDLIDRRTSVSIEECIINARKNLDLLPSNHIDEINAEFHRCSRIDIILKEYLKGIDTLGYDYLIIDCGPQRTRINDAVLCYIDNVVMPVQVEAASVRAVGNIYEYLSDLRLDPGLVSLVVPNMYDQRTNDAKENLDSLKEFYSDKDILTPPVN
ncbi:MAG: ParA family protein [Bacillota bacterium]|nr:ParA family protein [Bacillota bacterium]